MNICGSKTNIAFARDAVKTELLLPDDMIKDLKKSELCNLLKLCKNDRLPAAPFMSEPVKVGNYMIAVYVHSPFTPAEFGKLLGKPEPTLRYIKKLAEKLGVDTFTSEDGVTEIKNIIINKLMSMGIPEPIRVHLKESKTAMANGNMGEVAQNNNAVRNNANGGPVNNNNSARVNNGSGNNSARNNNSARVNNGSSNVPSNNGFGNNGVKSSNNGGIGGNGVKSSNNGGKSGGSFTNRILNGGRAQQSVAIGSGGSAPSYVVQNKGKSVYMMPPSGGGGGGSYAVVNRPSAQIPRNYYNRRPSPRYYNNERRSYSRSGGLPWFYNQKKRLEGYYTSNRLRDPTEKTKYNKMVAKLNANEKAAKNNAASKRNTLAKLLKNGSAGGFLGFGKTPLTDEQKAQIAFLLELKDLSGLNNASNMNKVQAYYKGVIRSKLYKNLARAAGERYPGGLGNLKKLRNSAKNNQEVIGLLNLLGSMNEETSKAVIKKNAVEAGMSPKDAEKLANASVAEVTAGGSKNAPVPVVAAALVNAGMTNNKAKETAAAVAVGGSNYNNARKNLLKALENFKNGEGNPRLNPNVFTNNTNFLQVLNKLKTENGFPENKLQRFREAVIKSHGAPVVPVANLAKRLTTNGVPNNVAKAVAEEVTAGGSKNAPVPVVAAALVNAGMTKIEAKETAAAVAVGGGGAPVVPVAKLATNLNKLGVPKSVANAVAEEVAARGSNNAPVPVVVKALVNAGMPNNKATETAAALLPGSGKVKKMALIKNILIAEKNESKQEKLKEIMRGISNGNITNFPPEGERNVNGLLKFYNKANASAGNGASNANLNKLKANWVAAINSLANKENRQKALNAALGANGANAKDVYRNALTALGQAVAPPPNANDNLNKLKANWVAAINSLANKENRQKALNAALGANGANAKDVYRNALTALGPAVAPPPNANTNLNKLKANWVAAINSLANKENRQKALNAALGANGANAKDVYRNALTALGPAVAPPPNANANANLNKLSNTEILTLYTVTSKGRTNEASKKIFSRLASNEDELLKLKLNNNNQKAPRRAAFIKAIKAFREHNKALKNAKTRNNAAGNGVPNTSLNRLKKEWNAINKALNANGSITKTLEDAMAVAELNNNGKKAAYKAAINAMSNKLKPAGAPPRVTPLMVKERWRKALNGNKTGVGIIASQVLATELQVAKDDPRAIQAAFIKAIQTVENPTAPPQQKGNMWKKAAARVNAAAKQRAFNQLKSQYNNLKARKNEQKGNNIHSKLQQAIKNANANIIKQRKAYTNAFNAMQLLNNRAVQKKTS
jgi:uncharacterized protein with GYD domain